MFRRSCAALILLVLPGCAQRPAVDLTPKQFSFETVEGGPEPYQQKLTLRTDQAWKASADSGVLVKPQEGTGPATIAVSLHGSAVFRKAGSYTAKVTVKLAKGETGVIPVTIKLAPRAPGPKFTYVSGPKGCTKPPDLPDEAICKVPDERPPGTFQPPAAGQSYIDPNFGAKVRILAGPQALHGYSTPSAVSANNRYALVTSGEQRQVVDLKSGEVKSRPKTPIEGVMWDARNEDVYYYVAGVQVVRYEVSANKTSTVADYSKGPLQFKKIITGASSDTSKDNWMAFWAPAEGGVCALDLNTAKSYCSKYDPATVGLGLNPDNGAAIVSKGIDRDSKKRYVVLAARPAAAIYTVNESTGKLDFEHLGPELPEWPGNGDGVCQEGERCLTGDHWDTVEDSSGVQYLFGALETQTPCEYSIYSLQLSKGLKAVRPTEVGGGRKRVMTLFRCGGQDPWTDYHVGCAKAAPYCVFSTTNGAFESQRKEGDFTAIKRGAHLSEVLVVRADGTEVRRLMEHRSVPLKGEEAQSYWTTPRACISGDGSVVVLDSNFGEMNRQRVVVVETGFGK